METNKKYWQTWYLAVLLFLLVQVVVFYWLTQKFS